MQPDLSQYNNLPRFPDGRINYTAAGEAPIINCFALYNGMLLLLKRSDKVAFAKGKWHIVAGFIDEPKDIEEKALEELVEETGITIDSVQSVFAYPPVTKDGFGKRWIIYPVLVTLKEQPEIALDFEHTKHAWIDPAQIGDYDVIDDVKELLVTILKK